MSPGSRTDKLSVHGHHHPKLLSPLLSAGQHRLKDISSFSVHAFPDCDTWSMRCDFVPVGIGKVQLWFSPVQEKIMVWPVWLHSPKELHNPHWAGWARGEATKGSLSLLPKASFWPHSRTGIHRPPLPWLQEIMQEPEDKINRGNWVQQFILLPEYL